MLARPARRIAMPLNGCDIHRRPGTLLDAMPA
jgi:hypothetical protein